MATVSLDREPVALGGPGVAFGADRRQPTPNHAHPVHIHCLVEKGVHLLEVADLEALSRTATYEFSLIMVPMKIRGGTASPIRPLALV